MTEQGLSEEWARSQLEAWTDGSLMGENRRRMAAALAVDPTLRAAAERSAAVQRALRSSRPPRLPAGLRRRLLAIPGRSIWSSFALPVAAGVAVAIVAAVVVLRPVPPPPVEDPRAVAIQEFELAMRYLQKSARMTQTEVTSAVGAGLRDAVAASREALHRQTDETGG
jgi:hypothetical protein